MSGIFGLSAKRKQVIVGAAIALILLAGIALWLHSRAESSAQAYHRQLVSYAKSLKAAQKSPAKLAKATSQVPTLDSVRLGAWLSGDYAQASDQAAMNEVYVGELVNLTDDQNESFRRSFNKLYGQDLRQRTAIEKAHKIAPADGVDELMRWARDNAVKLEARHAQAQTYRRQLDQLQPTPLLQANLSEYKRQLDAETQYMQQFIDQIKTVTDDDPMKALVLSDQYYFLINRAYYAMDDANLVLNYRVQHASIFTAALVDEVVQLAEQGAPESAVSPELTARVHYVRAAAAASLPKSFDDDLFYDKGATIRYLLGDLQARLNDNSDAAQLKSTVSAAYQTARLYRTPDAKRDVNALPVAVDHVHDVALLDYYNDDKQIYAGAHERVAVALQAIPNSKFISNDRQKYVMEIHQIEDLSKQVGAIGDKYQPRIAKLKSDDSIDAFIQLEKLRHELKNKVRPLEAKIDQHGNKASTAAKRMIASYGGSVDKLNDMVKTQLAAIKTS